MPLNLHNNSIIPGFRKRTVSQKQPTEEHRDRLLAQPE